MTNYDHADNMAEAIDNIEGAWETGDLAEAVREAVAAAAEWRASFDDVSV